jgi:pyridoxine 5-phosphate synthase
LDVVKLRRQIEPVVRRLKRKGIEVSAFIEPQLDHVRASADVGCDAVELWTGGYAHARGGKAVQAALKQLAAAIEAGRKAGLVVHAGHGLTYQNVGPVAALSGFAEFNIGHSIVSRAVFVGMREAVREMKALIGV